MFPEAGEKLGPYEILGELGGGGMARVYRAWDGRLHREVAIKVIDDHLSMPGIGERFLREARAASGLNHPNICTIFDIGEQDGAPYLVMELLEGETLRDRINQETITAEEILRYSSEVADALAAAHARGIVHRDVKPANIFLVKKPNGFGQAKMLDFGLAKIEQYASEEREFFSNLTTMGATVGTVSYMSPEQARGEKLDARSDLFSLGIMMYEMATGQLPFRGNTSALVFVQLLGQMAPEPIRKFNGQIPAELEHIIMKLLAKSPRARYQTATELTDELQELAEQRSGWLTRLKTQTPVETVAAATTGPSMRPPGKGQPNRPIAGKQRPEPYRPDPFDGAISARPSNPQAARAAGWRHSAGRGDYSSRRAPGEEHPERASEMRPVRTSIASNPRMSYPTDAPYVGLSGQQRAVSSTELQSSSVVEAQTRTAGEDRPPSFSGMRSVAQNTRPFGRYEVLNGDFPPLEEEGHGIPWQLIALALAILVLTCGFLAWKLGWLGAVVPLQSGALLLVRLPASRLVFWGS